VQDVRGRYKSDTPVCVYKPKRQKRVHESCQGWWLFNMTEDVQRKGESERQVQASVVHRNILGLLVPDRGGVFVTV
jgi:hypothetical protein